MNIPVKYVVKAKAGYVSRLNGEYHYYPTIELADSLSHGQAEFIAQVLRDSTKEDVVVIEVKPT